MTNGFLDRRRMPLAVCDVAVIGAGPYGLAAAAHLRGATDLDLRIFGDPMSFWRAMPRGMLLRSAWEASHIAFPSGDLSLEAYLSATKKRFAAPIPLACFVDYGMWVQERVAADVDRRRVISVRSEGDGFAL